MRKSLFIMAPVALALLAGVGTANAATNAEITITANVVPATCDVSISKSNLDLGNYSKGSFTAVATPIAASVKTLSLGLSDCDGTANASGTPGLLISGQTLPGHNNMFNSYNTNNTGIMLSQVATPTTYLTAGQTITFDGKKVTSATEANGKVLTLNAGLASTSITAPSLGLVSAPILFSFSYN